MRAGVVIVGSILLAIGVVAAGGGGAARSVGEACVQMRCGDNEPYFIGMIGTGALYAGIVLGLAGVGIVIAGILAEPRSRVVPVQARARPCPACGASLASGARACAACGAAVAPVASA